MIRKTDVYGPVATEYTARPVYPNDLFAYLAAQCEQRVVAWDCGCGSGQASRGLSDHFEVVIATDPSGNQLSQAAPAGNIEYRQAPAESSGLPSSSVDLVCAFMAAHWFDLDAFYAEALRVAKPDAIIALLVYGEPFTGQQKVDDIIEGFSSLTGPYGGAAIQRMRQLYSDLEFPFRAELQLPSFQMEARYLLERFLSYTRSRASVMDFGRQHSRDVVASFGAQLARHWPRGQEINVYWPLKGRIGKIASHRDGQRTDRQVQLASSAIHAANSL